MTEQEKPLHWAKLVEEVKELVEEVKETLGGPADDVPSYKKVGSLSLGDSLVLTDGAWEVTGLQSDAFDEDIVSIILSNGESYDLLRNSLVEVKG